MRRFSSKVNAGLALAGFAVLFSETACVPGARIRADAQGVQQQIVEARKQGAYQCAPEQDRKSTRLNSSHTR